MNWIPDKGPPAMKNFTTAAIVSLAGLGLSAPEVLAWGCCGHHCTKTYKVVCTQYNAFSPWCCQPVAKHGLFHKCCKPDMVMNCQPMCGSPCGSSCGDGCCADGSCGPQATTPAGTTAAPGMPLQRMPAGAPNPQAMTLHPAMIQMLQNSMMQPPMNYPMPPMMGQPMMAGPQQMMGQPMMAPQMMGQPMMAGQPMMMPPMMGGQPMMAGQPMMGGPQMMMPPMPHPGMARPYPQGYPVGYYPPPNQALIAPPGTMGLPPMGQPNMMMQPQ